MAAFFSVCRYDPKRTGKCAGLHEPGDVMLNLTFGPIARDLRGLHKKQKLKILVQVGYIM
jgi:hypothetical protein